MVGSTAEYLRSPYGFPGKLRLGQDQVCMYGTCCLYTAFYIHTFINFRRTCIQWCCRTPWSRWPPESSPCWWATGDTFTTTTASTSPSGSSSRKACSLTSSTGSRNSRYTIVCMCTCCVLYVHVYCMYVCIARLKVTVYVRDLYVSRMCLWRFKSGTSFADGHSWQCNLTYWSHPYASSCRSWPTWPEWGCYPSAVHTNRLSPIIYNIYSYILWYLALAKFCFLPSQVHDYFSPLIYIE